MADYYSLLARAVANLPKTSPPSTRRAIYERARKALTNQLRSLKPQLPESDIAREERALDDAVARLEAEYEPAPVEARPQPPAPGEPDETAPATASPASATASPASATASPASTTAPPASATAPPAPPAPAPPPPPQAAPVSAPTATARPAETPPRSPLPARPAAPGAPKPPPSRSPVAPPPTAAKLPNAGAFKGPLLGAAAGSAAADPAASAEPLLGPARSDAAAETASPLVAAASRYEREPARPMLTDTPRRKTPTWLWIAGAVAVGFAGSIAVVALVMRPALQDLSVPAPVDTPAASAGQEKTLRRVGQAGPAETPAPSTTGAVDASQSSPSPDAATPAGPTPTVVASSSPSAAPNPAATPNAQPTLAIASRAAMLVATVADAAKPAINVGTAVWSVVPAPAGQPAAMIGVKSEIDIPDLKMHASMILRKNFDTSLPASHTIDLRVSFDPGSPIKGVKDIALPLMRRDDPPAADALTGVRVKISDNYFLVGLNRADADVAKNVQEVAERNWFDFPMQLDDDRIAKLTFEKGADGEKIVAQALAAWK